MTRAMGASVFGESDPAGAECAPVRAGSARAWFASPRRPPRRSPAACRPTSPRRSRSGCPRRPRRATTSRRAAPTRCPASRPRASRPPPAEPCQPVDTPRHRRNVEAAMGQVLLAMFGPTVVFGLFALLAMRFGAESRPYFDERPVVDDRPNWFPIAGSGGDDDDEDDDEPPDDGTREAVPAPARRQPALPLASARSAAPSPPGV